MSKQISAKIRELRCDHNWTQADLDERAKLPPGTIGQYENGRTPGIDALRKIAKALMVALGELVGE